MNRTIFWDGRSYIRPVYPYQKWTEVSRNSSIEKNMSDDGKHASKSWNKKIKESDITELDVSENSRPLTPDGGETSEICPQKDKEEFKNTNQCSSKPHDTMENFREFILCEADCGEARYPLMLGTEGHSIREFIETKVKKLQDFLNTNFRMFENCQLLKQGSVYEGTKINKPDEFDFMFEIPSVQKYNAVQIIPPSTLDDYIHDAFHCEVVDPEFFSDITTHPLSQYNATRDGINEYDKAKLSFEKTSIIKILLIHVSRIFQSKFNEFFPDDCKYKSIHTQVEVERAMTFTLLWRGKEFPWLPISIDFVLGVPLQDSISMHYKYSTHAIFYNHQPRISFSCLETSLLSQYSIGDGRIRFMRLMKWFKDNFYPKEVNVIMYSSCFIESEALLSTYPIKNIVFYMLHIYGEDEEAFFDQELPYRIVEAFQILLECCKRQTLYSFFFPLGNLMHVDENQDNREKKIEDFKIIESSTKAILDAIQCMENNPNSLSNLQKKSQLENTDIKEGLFRRTIKELADYARQNYQKEALERLQAFCIYLNDFYDTDYKINGHGENIEFSVDGYQIDIVDEILKIHKGGV